jgi:hypothetical protein
VEAASFNQQTYGWCSPAVGQTEGNVTITCHGIDPQAMQLLNERLNTSNLDLQQKTREANELIRTINELSRQVETPQDKKLAQETRALLRQGKLEEEEADTRLRQSEISMAQFQALQTGMRYQDVVRVLGRPGEEVSRGESVLGYIWRNTDMSLVTVVFINGRMHTASQSELYK